MRLNFSDAHYCRTLILKNRSVLAKCPSQCWCILYVGRKAIYYIAKTLEECCVSLHRHIALTCGKPAGRVRPNCQSRQRRVPSLSDIRAPPNTYFNPGDFKLQPVGQIQCILFSSPGSPKLTVVPGCIATAAPTVPKHPCSPPLPRLVAPEGRVPSILGRRSWPPRYQGIVCAAVAVLHGRMVSSGHAAEPFYCCGSLRFGDCCFNQRK